MRTALLLAACFAGGVLPVVGQAATPTTPLPSIALPTELDRVLRDYERAWRAGDRTALAALFTPDGLVPSRAGWVRGSTAIAKNYANAAGPLRLQALAYAIADSVGYIVGTFGYGASAKGSGDGKFVLALRRGANGPWRIAADLDN